MADSGIAAGSALLPPPQAKALNAISSTGKNLATGVGNAMAGNGSLSQNLKKASIDSMIDLGQINASNYVTRGITNIIGEGERTFLKEYVDKGKDFNYDEAIGRALNDAAWKGGSKWFVDESINYATSKMTHPMNLGNELREARSSSYGMMLGMGEEAATMAKYQAYSGVLKQCHEANKVRKVTAVLGETVKKGFTGIES